MKKVSLMFLTVILLLIGMGSNSAFAAEKYEEKITAMLENLYRFEYGILYDIEQNDPEVGKEFKIKLDKDTMAKASALYTDIYTKKPFSTEKNDNSLILKYKIGSKEIKKISKNLFGKCLKVSDIKSDMICGYTDLYNDAKEGCFIQRYLNQNRGDATGIYPYITDVTQKGKKYIANKLCFFTVPGKRTPDEVRYLISYTLKKSSKSKKGFVISDMTVMKLDHDISEAETYVLMLSDVDGDELPIGLEMSYGTDPFYPDTDQDTIYDYIEVCNGKNPLDPNDVDGENTSSDIDWDGLKDYDEILVYGTDPMKSDTDDDGLSDGMEIKYKFDPFNPDSDNNGIKDGDESIRQTYVFNARNLGWKFDEYLEAAGEKWTFFGDEMTIPKDLGALEEIDITASVNGNIKYIFDIRNMFGEHVMLTCTPFIVGIPVEIKIDEENLAVKFKSAQLVFKYDDSVLVKGTEEYLAVGRYIDGNGFEIIDGFVLDKEKNTVSCTITEGGYYFLVTAIEVED